MSATDCFELGELNGEKPRARRNCRMIISRRTCTAEGVSDDSDRVCCDVANQV